MKKPLASDFVVDVMDTHVNVVFTPNGNPYMFGRLVDPDDIAHYGPVSRTMGTGVGEKGSTPRVTRQALVSPLAHGNPPSSRRLFWGLVQPHGRGRPMVPDEQHHRIVLHIARIERRYVVVCPREGQSWRRRV